MSRPSILVYGATSYTAVNHLLPYLVNHPEANKFDLVLAGRSAERLQAANTLIGGGKRELIVCDLADFDAVGHMVQRADLFINLAGEYSTAGWQLGKVLFRVLAWPMTIGNARRPSPASLVC
jgi:short subunit dehydrogenase-like uncharacterized protein